VPKARVSVSPDRRQGIKGRNVVVMDEEATERVGLPRQTEPKTEHERDGERERKNHYNIQPRREDCGCHFSFFFPLSRIYSFPFGKILQAPPFSPHVLLGKGQELIMNDLSIAFPADGRGKARQRRGPTSKSVSRLRRRQRGPAGHRDLTPEHTAARSARARTPLSNEGSGSGCSHSSSSSSVDS